MLPRTSQPLTLGLVTLAVLAAARGRSQERSASPTPDSTAKGVEAVRAAEALKLRWPAGEGRTAELELDLRAGRPLVRVLAIARAGREPAVLAREVEPAFWITVGSRTAPEGRPPDMPVWNVFFDRPASRPYRTHRLRREAGVARLSAQGSRQTVTLPSLRGGGFSGELQLTLFPGSPLVQVEAVVSTAEDRRAILYDTGLVGAAPGWRSLAWTDTAGRPGRADVDLAALDRSLAVRHRALAAEGEGGTLLCLPPPHQFFFPTDWTDNFKFTWHGRDHSGEATPFGFGIRQDPVQRGAFVPWFNAPPGTAQRLGVFYHLAERPATEALAEALRYTRGDRFAKLPGHTTFTSHWHMAIAVAAMEQRARGVDPLPVPSFVRMFRDMGVDAVHLGEFHGDGHPRDPGALRLPEMEAMFAECRRLSGDGLLLIPGEEINDYLGIKEPGKHPGHWMSLFPRPVYWTQVRAPGQPFTEEHPRYGTVYHVGSKEDAMELLRRQRGLAWTAHPRIKASSWTPDIFRREDFYRSDRWLGAAWKAMPADLSRPKLGERGLDLLSDMANWGDRKYLPGEVDVFKIDPTHELFGHMNVNYLRLSRLPKYEEGWQPVLDALSGGRFWTTTGEVLIRSFQVDGKESGQALTAGGRPELRAELDWTFPLSFAEVVSGDGERTYRERIELADTGAFGRRTLRLRPELRGRRWVRLEVWDVARSGAYTQPVWLEPASSDSARVSRRQQSEE